MAAHERTNIRFKSLSHRTAQIPNLLNSNDYSAVPENGAISTQLAELLWKQIGRQKAAGHSFLFTVGNGSPLDINVERSRRLAPLLETMELAKAGSHAFRHFNLSIMDAQCVPSRRSRRGLPMR